MKVWVLLTIMADDTLVEAFTSKKKALATCVNDMEDMTSEEVEDLYEFEEVMLEDGTVLAITETDVK